MSDPLLQRLEQLETQQAFQEDTIEKLNQALTQLQFDYSQLKVQTQILTKRIRQMQPSTVAHESEETPPPHY